MHKPRLTTLAVVAALIFVGPRPAHAMHIAEGILPIGWAGLWFAVAAPFVLWGLHTINRRRAADPRATTMIALVGAGVFLVSCMPVPIPLAGLVLLRCLEQADRTHESMVARGFTGRLPLASMRPLRRGEWGMLAAWILAVLSAFLVLDGRLP